MFLKISASVKKESFNENVSQLISLFEDCKDASGDLDYVKVSALEDQITVRKTALEEDYEARKKHKKKHKKEKKHKHHRRQDKEEDQHEND